MSKSNTVFCKISNHNIDEPIAAEAGTKVPAPGNIPRPQSTPADQAPPAWLGAPDMDSLGGRIISQERHLEEAAASLEDLASAVRSHFRRRKGVLCFSIVDGSTYRQLQGSNLGQDPHTMVDKLEVLLILRRLYIRANSPIESWWFNERQRPRTYLAIGHAHFLYMYTKK